MAISTINPTTGKTERTFDPLTETAIKASLANAERAAVTTRGFAIERRADWLREAAQLLRAEKETLGALMTREMGKTHASAIAEAEKCA